MLEIGCGCGAGSSVVHDVLHARVVFGLDLDRKMLETARRRTEWALVEADAGVLPAREQTFDAVVDFGAIHLVADWPQALAEVRRVLKPGGKYYFEWVTIRALRLGYRLAAEGFQAMHAPRADEVLQVLDEVGLVVEGRVQRRRVLAGTQLVGDLIGVGLAA